MSEHTDREPAGGGTASKHDRLEAETEREILEESAAEEVDPLSSREALEEELMEEGRSEEGEHIP